MAGKTYPSVQVTWAGKWCAGHAWRSRGRLAWWLHHVGHRAGILRYQCPQMTYIEGKP